MAIQVSYGGVDDFNALVYKQKSPEMIAFIDNQFNKVSTTLNDAGRKFFQCIPELYNQFNSSESMRLARAAVRRAGSFFQRDEVRSIWDIAGLQQAPFVMQRFIIAEPTVRQMYHDQRCEGYPETYIDQSPKDIGEEHYDYRRVMNGIVVDDEEGEWKTSFYLDELLPGDIALELDQQDEIISTWEIVKMFMEAGREDPTSPLNSNL